MIMGWYNEELYHHGIRGQKWGVRRFQNADGSLTSAGQKRYAKQIKAKEEAINNLRDLKSIGERDADKFSKLSKNSPTKVSKSQMDKFLKDEFGDDVNNSYPDSVAKDHGYKDRYEYAKSELTGEKQRLANLSRDAKTYSKKCDALIKHYSDKNVTDISKEEYKELKKIANSYYSPAYFNFPYSDLNRAYSRIYGE